MTASPVNPEACGAATDHLEDATGGPELTFPEQEAEIATVGTQDPQILGPVANSGFWESYIGRSGHPGKISVYDCGFEPRLGEDSWPWLAGPQSIICEPQSRTQQIGFW